MIVGCYSIHLYCDNAENLHGTGDDEHDFHEFPHEFTGETRGECMKEARRRGWLINLSADKALCPKCSGKNRRAE